VWKDETWKRKGKLVDVTRSGSENGLGGRQQVIWNTMEISHVRRDNVLDVTRLNRAKRGIMASGMIRMIDEKATKIGRIMQCNAMVKI